MRIIKYIPNTLTLSRIVIVMVYFLTLVQERFNLALTLFLLALITDMFDGFLARHFQVTSKIGEEVLEVLADSLMVFLSILGFTLIKILPWWFFTIMCLGAIPFLWYTRKSKSPYVKNMTIVIQLLGFGIFVVSTSLFLTYFISGSVTLLVIMFLALAAYFKKDRMAFVFDHFKKIFFESKKEKRI